MKLNQLRARVAIFPFLERVCIGAYRTLREAILDYTRDSKKWVSPMPTYGEPIPSFDESERDYDDEAHGVPDPDDIKHRSIPAATFFFVLAILVLFLFCGMFPTHEKEAVCDAPSCRFMAERVGETR